MKQKSTNILNIIKEKNHKQRREARIRKITGARIRKQTNERWKHVETSGAYRKAAAQKCCNTATRNIETEILDGMVLKLNDCNKTKSPHVQDRILRRIVEKRMAQASHKKYGRHEDLTTMRFTQRHMSRCMENIKRKRQAASA